MKRLTPQDYFDKMHTYLAAAQDRVHSDGQRYAQMLSLHALHVGRECDAMVLKDPALATVMRERMTYEAVVEQAERDFTEARSRLAERLVDMREATVGLSLHLAAGEKIAAPEPSDLAVEDVARIMRERASLIREVTERLIFEGQDTGSTSADS